jgi:predicted Zn-dependent protease
MKTNPKFLVLLLFFLPSIFLSSCSKDENEDTTFNIFSLEDDITFGKQLQLQIESDPDTYTLLDTIQYADAYAHVYRIRDSILNSGKLIYGDKFEWSVRILQDDSVLNAFAAPGGYIFIYTGIIKYLDSEAQFAGVLGHEMTHADRRHSTDQLTKAYGIQILLGVLLGNNPNQMAAIAANLAAGVASLAFSRDAEYEADEYSVKYLYETAYDARGVGGFFEKMEGNPQPPEFLSTHPNPGNRVDKIEEIWLELGGKAGGEFEESYQVFKSTIP